MNFHLGGAEERSLIYLNFITRIKGWKFHILTPPPPLLSHHRHQRLKYSHPPPPPPPYHVVFKFYSLHTPPPPFPLSQGWKSVILPKATLLRSQNRLSLQQHLTLQYNSNFPRLCHLCCKGFDKNIININITYFFC